MFQLITLTSLGSTTILTNVKFSFFFSLRVLSLKNERRIIINTNDMAVKVLEIKSLVSL